MSEYGNENLWQPLRMAIKGILEKGDSTQPYEDLYRSAHVMVVQGHGKLLHEGLREAIRDHLVNKVRPAVLASAPDAFLQTINQAWNDHQSSMKQIRGIVMYLEQTYVQRHKLCSVQNLGLLLFRDEVARHGDIRDRLQASLLQTMNRDRDGEVVDRLSVKNACQMLLKLGINSRSVYEEDFERPFLAESAKFYALESQMHLAEKSTIDYIHMVEQRINEESQRAKFCLDPGTELLIYQVVYQQLVANHVKAIVEKQESGVVAMLKNQRVEELPRIFRLLSHSENGLQRVEQNLSTYLREVGRSLMVDELDSLTLITKLMTVKERHELILSACFSDECRVKQIIHSDFEYILNLTRKPAEHLAVFADDTLRNKINGMTQPEIQQRLENIVTFVRLLHEKDIFEHFYNRFLCKRLLLNKYSSLHAEAAMVSMLKVECGPAFVSKLEAMMIDISISSSTIKDFKSVATSCRLELHGVDLNVRVLRTGFWPFPTFKQQCIIPSAPLAAFEAFRRFYLSKHIHRLLNLQPHLGWADLEAVFYPPEEPSTSADPSKLSEPRTYMIVVSTYQMCVLMLFNSRDKITYDDIASETRIPKTSLVRALESLTMGRADQRVLVKEPPTNDIEQGHVFAVNESFVTDLPKVTIHTVTPRKKDNSRENKYTTRHVDEDGRFVIEAAIVRIMKSERKISHSELVAKLTELLSSRFTPRPEAIKKRIEALIDREYLQRTPENADVYIYIP